MKFEQLQVFRQLAFNASAMPAYATFEQAEAVMNTRHVWCLGDFARSSLI
jgi:hypothetical protein